MSVISSLKFHYRRWRALRDATRTLPPPTPEEQEAASALHREFAELSVQPTHGVPALEADWNSAMNRLRELGSSADPRAFQRWDVIVARMAQSNSAVTATELSSLKSDPDWESRWRDALQEVAAGTPCPYPEYPDSSETLIQTAYHTRALEALSTRRIEDWDVIIEFGGGFGGLCRLMYTLGFRGRYLIFDLPTFSILQRYYLTSVGLCRPEHSPPCHSERSEESAFPEITLSSDWRKLEAFVDAIAPSESAVLWGTWSISESPLSVRERLKPLAQRIGHYCIAYQCRYGDIDNSAWFAHEWLDGPRVLASIAHRPRDYYLAGRTR